MIGRTLFSEIMDEARSYNPTASPTEIADGIVAVMEKEILPRVLRDVSLPSFPSWSDMLLSESRRRRIPKRFRSARTMAERRTLLQQIEHVRRQLVWDGTDTAEPTPHPPDLTNLTERPKPDVSSLEKIPKHNGKEAEIETTEDSDKPYSSVSPPAKAKSRITFSEGLQRRIISDPFLEKTFKNIEVGMRELIDARNLTTDVDVSFRPDFEIPSWRKCVIKVYPPSGLNFKDKMNVWTIFDLTIRNEITQLARDAGDDMKEYLNNLNKDLYVHVEL